MSCNRENVTWQSADGTWNRGFYRCYDVGDTSDPDWDYEWDVDYDFDRFEWVSVGHKTREAAHDSWNGANPGGTIISEFNPKYIKETELYDEMAKKLLDSGWKAW